jgi:F-type H+-transporting ATPase subunit delta
VADVRVARRYAQALFNTAKAQNVLGVLEEDLNGVSQILHGDSGLRQYLYNPTVSRSEKKALLNKHLQGKANQLTLSLLDLLLEKGREQELDHVRLQYIELRRQYEQVSHVVVTSSEEMEEDQRRALVDKLTRTLGRTIEAEFKTDPKLIGGITVAFDNYVLDGSLSGALSKIKEKIFRDALKQS